MTGIPVLVSTECRMAARTRLVRVAVVVVFLLGIGIGNVEGTGAAMSAYATGEAACQYLAIVAAIWSGLAALRDTAQRVDVLIFTKPQPPERLAFARYAGVVFTAALLLVALFVGAMVGRLIGSGSLAGYAAYPLQFGRAALVLFFSTGAGFALALLGQSPIAGGLVGLMFVAAIGGKAFLPKAAFPWYAQNQAGFTAVTVFLLGIALWFGRRSLRGDRPASTAVRVLVPVSLAVACIAFGKELKAGHDPMVREDPRLLRFAAQTIAMQKRTPGFLLPGPQGNTVDLTRNQGKILVISLFSPQDADSGVLLAELERVRKQYGDRGVQPIAICLSEDAGAPATFAAGERLSYPVVHDWGTHNAPQATERSPMALAYLADRLPLTVVTDRRHRVRFKLDGTDAYSRRSLDPLLSMRLKAEPE